MTNMDDQIAKHCKGMILRATQRVAEQREKARQAETLYQAVRVLRDQAIHPEDLISQHAASGISKIRQPVEERCSPCMGTNRPDEAQGSA